jgi:hypothetical protein
MREKGSDTRPLPKRLPLGIDEQRVELVRADPPGQKRFTQLLKVKDPGARG